MGHSKHELIIYSNGLGYDENVDPSTKSSFSLGDKVVICRKKNSLISLRSLKANNYECPFCFKKLNSDLAIVGVADIISGTTKIPPPLPSSRLPAYFAALAGVMLLFFIVSVIGVFGFLDFPLEKKPLPINTQIKYTNTPVLSQPRSTSTQPPSPTARPILSPTTYLSGPLSSCSAVKVAANISSKGTILHITPCSGPVYDLGPFSNGVYEVAESNKFIVYVSADIDGSVYIAKIGDTTLVRLGRLRQDHNFSAFFKSETPSYRLELTDDWLTVYEEKFRNTGSYPIPSKYTR